MKLGTKLILYLVGIVIVAMGIHGYLTIRQDRSNFTREMRMGMRGFSRAIQAALSDLYAEGQDPRLTREFVDRVGNKGNIHGLVVYDREGRRVAVSASLRDSRDYPQLDPDLVLGIDPRPVLESGKGTEGYRRSPGHIVYYRMEPIFDSRNRVVGAFVLGRQSGSLFDVVAVRRDRILITTVALVVVLIILILVIVRRSVSRPIQDLIARARDIGQGRWTQRLEASGSDEIGALAREFNRMSERLQETYSRLVREQQDKLRLERELRHSEKLASVGQLAAGLAHEIGTPLSIIGGRAEYLLRRPRSEEEARDTLLTIHSQIDRISGIVRRLLTFSRRHEPALQPVELPTLLAQVRALFEDRLRERSVQVVTELPATLPPLQADPNLLQQVFINLYLNSLEAVAPGGTIRIRAAADTAPASPDSAPAGVIRVLFEDDGRGIPPEHLERIFDPFYTTKDVGEGTGLGLSVAYGIVKDHGGEIRAESEPGRSTCFILEFPLPAAREAGSGAGSGR